jgi:hypothetical protein
MIIAVIAMPMMEVAADKIIGVIAVRNRLVPAARAMGVALFVSRTAVRRCALRWIGRIDSDAALVDVIAVDAMHVTVVQIVAVVAVLNGLVSAARLMNMLV